MAAKTLKGLVERIGESYWYWHKLGYESAGVKIKDANNYDSLINEATRVAEELGLKWYQRVPFYRGVIARFDDSSLAKEL